MIYYADPRAFPDALLLRLLPLLPKKKQTAIAKIVHQPTKRQAITAWALLVFALHMQTSAIPTRWCAPPLPNGRSALMHRR